MYRFLIFCRQAFDEEKDAVREIYEKRISAMEKRYEKIITDFKIQLEESLTSEDETSFKDAFGTPSSVVSFFFLYNTMQFYLPVFKVLQ